MEVVAWSKQDILWPEPDLLDTDSLESAAEEICDVACAEICFQYKIMQFLVILFIYFCS